MKELFPLNTFQQDAVLKRMNELLEASKDIVDGSEHLFENITDSQGHKRFEDYEINVNAFTGVNYVYLNASLSGSHLLIVIFGTIENGTAFEGGTLGYILLPQWIKDKITNVYSSIVDQKTILLFASNGTTQSAYSYLQKRDNNDIAVYLSAVTLTANRTFRIVFDLLIDNEEPVNP